MTPGKRLQPDSFWPGVELDSLRRRLRLSSEYSQARIEVAAHLGQARVHNDCAPLRQRLRGLGYARLDALPEGHTLHRAYWRAVVVQTRLALKQLERRVGRCV